MPPQRLAERVHHLGFSFNAMHNPGNTSERTAKGRGESKEGVAPTTNQLKVEPTVSVGDEATNICLFFGRDSSFAFTSNNFGCVKQSSSYELLK